jgi:pilus assembly protein FimV
MNRPPKKTIAVTLAGLFLALTATISNAAGLGKMTVNSALGQPLSVEIELVSLLPGEFEVLTARTASPEAYTESRIEYSPLLRQLRFAIERKANGTPIVKITSNTAINEPFLDVLVEMTWPAGRLVREYPILLDPPGFNEAKIQAPVAAVTPRPATTTVAASTTIPSAAATRSESEKPKSDADTYGPVKRGDTLAKIASEMKGDGISLDQMLVALFRENKQAFSNNNMNQLKTGQILRIPNAADVAKITKAEANKEVRVQVADWKGYREQIASAAAAAPAKPATTNVATGQVASAKPVTPPAPATADQLKIAKADSTGKAGATGAKGGTSAADAANAAKEDAIAKQKAMDEAKTRIALLEKQQADAKKLVELKTAPPVPTVAAAAPKAVIPTPPAAAPVVAPTPVPPTQVAQVSPSPTPAGTAPAPVVTPEAPKVEAPKVAAPPKVVAKAPPPPPEPELMDTVMEYAPIAAGIAGIGVLGWGALLFSRRRKQNADGASAMSQTSSLMPSDLKPNTITGNKAGGLVDTGNSSFLTDFDKTGPGAIDTDEVDPLAEADVYIAYGRDGQAEEILKEAITRDKNRHDVSMKLLEIYHARKSAAAFETVALQLKDAIGENDPMWAKAAAMGASIDPTNNLYGGRAFDSTASFAAGGTAMFAAAGSAAAEAAEAAKPNLDFDLGFDDAPQAKADEASSATFDITAPNSDQPAPAAGDMMDFDLDLGADPVMPAKSSTAASDSSMDMLLTDAGGLDFDLALDTPNAPSAPTASAPAAAASNFDFDLSSLSLDEPLTGNEATQKVIPVAPAAAKAAAPAAMSMDLSDLSLDLDEPASGASVGGADASAVATKLELAKAYIEIGDADGAKEILQEVAREGSAAQADEAKNILAGM